MSFGKKFGENILNVNDLQLYTCSFFVSHGQFYNFLILLNSNSAPTTLLFSQILASVTNLVTNSLVTMLESIVNLNMETNNVIYSQRKDMILKYLKGDVCDG